MHLCAHGRMFVRDKRLEGPRPADGFILAGITEVPKGLCREKGCTRCSSMVEGYIIEGRVPVEDIQRLLVERPEARGLSVPVRPAASPGMEGIGGAKRRYDVLLFCYDGMTHIYAHHDIRFGL